MINAILKVPQQQLKNLLYKTPDVVAGLLAFHLRQQERAATVALDFVLPHRNALHQAAALSVMSRISSAVGATCVPLAPLRLYRPRDLIKFQGE